MNKVIVFSFLMFSAFTSFVFSQSKVESQIPNIQLSLSATETVWGFGKEGSVKVVIANLSEKAVTLPDTISFTVTDGTKNTDVTMRDRVFWSPVSLTKTYDENAKGCQDDLIKERVGMLDNSNIRVIAPPAKNLVLEKDQKKEFNFDVARMCWNHVISSIYPDQSLFSLALLGKYKIYFEMSFRVGTYRVAYGEVPLSKTIQSNEIEIMINR